MNILITGRPGAGKTTLLKEIAHHLGAKAGGFYTEEIRQNGKRTGFRIITLAGREALLAGVGTSGHCRVGRYSVNVKDFEKVALPAVKCALAASKIILVDEIGPMELFSEDFRNVISEIFDSSNSVIATIKLRDSHFTEALKQRKDTVVYTLNNNNKNEIFKAVLKYI